MIINKWLVFERCVEEVQPQVPRPPAECVHGSALDMHYRASAPLRDSGEVSRSFGPHARWSHIAEVLLAVEAESLRNDIRILASFGGKKLFFTLRQMRKLINDRQLRDK